LSDTTEPEDAAPADEAPPRDPMAPTRHTLPSGKIVEAVSARTLTGADMAAAWGAQPASTYMENVTAMRNTLIARMVTEIEPGARSTTKLDGTVEAVLAQQPDDWKRLYMLAPVTDAMGLLQGTSVIPDVDEWEDPKAPTTPNSEPSPG
jgi:hypothetical protein